MRPASSAGSATSPRLLRAPARRPALVTVNPVPGARAGASTRGSGCQGLTWKNRLCRAGRPEPRPNTSTISGSPLDGSAQMSTRPTVDSGSAGVIRSPAAARPATRTGAITLNLARLPPSDSRRSASAGGTRSAARGSRYVCCPRTSVSSWSPESQM